MQPRPQRLSRVEISRTMDCIIDAIHVSNLQELTGWLCEFGPEDSWIISDLSLGSWRGHWVSTEICQQLGISSQTAQTVDPQSKNGYANNIAHSIDEECKGDGTI